MDQEQEPWTAEGGLRRLCETQRAELTRLSEINSHLLAEATCLLALADEAGWDSGYESDRVFTQGEFMPLRLAVQKAEEKRVNPILP